MARRSPKISPVHWGVLIIGLPVTAISAVLWTAYGFNALDMPKARPHDPAQIWRLLSWTITGQHATGDLTAARVFLAIFVIAAAGSIVVTILESRRLSGDSKRGPQLERNHALMDIPYWQVGDRGGWLDGGVHTGTIVEAHRRPFELNGVTVKAFAGGPGLVLKDDVTGELVGRDNGMLFRIAGTSGPSGTLESIHDEMTAAVSVGDGTSWIDPKGEVQEGTILEIKYEPFEVGGKRVDASKQFPGYVIARSPDGVHVGVSDKLREGV